ncbi:MAG: isovaleryl-CoA dehydrogenase [Rhodobiaceae bacterium]|nr:MAG: isovaleryl-CoA dehydrogenase [Rhodobiaceae bacterium]
MVHPSGSFETHEVTNQPPAFENINLFETDACLRDAVNREGEGDKTGALSRFGARVGSAEVVDLGRQANAYLPVLKSFDRFGHRADQVEFHPSYHALMSLSVEQGLHGSPWEHLPEKSAPQPGRNVTRLAGLYMMVQAEAGHMCPITMTNAAIPALQAQPDLAAEWIPRILSRSYDPSFKPSDQKLGVTLGMGMTEKQGGTDVRANMTRADPVDGGGPGGEYIVTGHKWFFSAPMCDAFLVLAQAPGGLSCFLMPRFLPDGTVNAIRVQRLKEKVGNKSNASSEVEFQQAHAWLIGEEGRGVRNILEMATHTRIDCSVSSSGLMRQGLAQALHHCSHRRVFQKNLIDQPLMQNVLADLALEVEGATALAFRVARAFDNADSNSDEAAYRRIMNPVAKYWACKRAPGFTYEAMECLGGNGYVEEGIVGRLYREAPVNAIWEGSGNVMCLDVLRAISRDGQGLESILNGFETVRGRQGDYDRALDQLKDGFTDVGSLELRARQVIESMAKIGAAAVLLDGAPGAIAESYCRTRLGGEAMSLYGGLPADLPLRSILDRAMPAE